MEKLFNFDYQQETIANQDGTPSRFSVVYGEGGNVVHTKKPRYTMVTTDDVQELGNRFIEKGMAVKGFSHMHGEVIGLNIELTKNRKTVIGDKSYNAIITIPNNGTLSGYMSISELVMWCLNGATRSTLKHKEVSLKILHDMEYKHSLQLMEEAILTFKDLIHESEGRDKLMNSTPLENEFELIKNLNQWFYTHEMPINQRTMSFDEFRRMLIENRDEVKSYGRYKELMKAKDRELEYNEQLNRPLSMYTVYASITNYLSRRREESKTKAPEELQILRQESKIKELEMCCV